MLCLAEHYQEWKKERISREEKILEDFKIVRKFVPDDLDIQQIVQSLEENKIEKDDWIVDIINKAYNLDIYNLNTEKENK